ncbi:membrane protein insertase YidC [Chitinimonas lacunae]|uniref:Membrane protein insertase YidC n=1 Tax=Chitinimonas lacunae TaxID=1963018 RepID=A0ABV8MTV1_9NEIS
MDTRRFILFVVLSFGILYGWSYLQHSQQPQRPAVVQQSGANPTAAATPSVAAAAPADTSRLQKGSRVRITTDLIDAEIDTMGGDLRRLSLLKHGRHEQPGTPLVLLDERPDHTYVAQTGLLQASLPNLPTHRTLFTTKDSQVRLENGQDSVSVRLEAAEVGGLKVAKIYTFKRNSYLIDVKYEIQNGGAAPVALSAYYRLLRDGSLPEGSGNGFFGTATFTGPAVYTDISKFQKVDFKDIDKGKAEYAHEGRDGWVAMIQHYFASAWLLSANGYQNVCARNACRFEVKSAGDGLYSAGAVVDLPAIQPGTTSSFSVPLFAGPQETRRLLAAAPGLEFVKDYGWTSVLARPIFTLLDMIHGLVGNWGWAIVLLTLLIKVVLLWPTAASYRSMARLKKLAPRMKRLQEQYADDRMKFQQAMMEMYKTEKVSPLGGCLPILVQIPVFIALYSVLLATVEMRQAPWVLWIKDLSLPDPYYVLPVIMTVSSYVQTFLNPPATDPMQDKMMKLMPLIFGVMFFFFPAGLVLYWVVNNLFSIVQQWLITRAIEKGDSPA